MRSHNLLLVHVTLLVWCATLLASEDGNIIAWGWNFYGQCNVPEPNSDFIAICSDWNHNLGLKIDKSIVAWGWCTKGRCDFPEPNSGFIDIAAGHQHSLGLKEDGSIVALGNNFWGQCSIPEPNSDFIGIAAGRDNSMGLKADGSIVVWGYAAYPVPSPNNDFIDIATGDKHFLGLKADGSIIAWGHYCHICDVPPPNSGFVAIVAGSYHSLGLKENGSIVAWGRTDYGQCDVPSPNSRFVAIAAGHQHSLGLKEDGSIVAWGRNDYGQCNIPSPNSEFVAIDGGFYHSIGLKSKYGFSDPKAKCLGNKLWNIKWFHCDLGNNTHALERNGTPICGSGNCPGQDGNCWGPIVTKKNCNFAGIFWTTSDVGRLELNYSKDYQVYGDTYLFSKFPKILEVQINASMVRVWLNDMEILPGPSNIFALPLIGGLNHLEWTEYDQTQPRYIIIDYPFSDNIDWMSSSISDDSDINCDDIVNFQDYAILGTYWLTSHPPFDLAPLPGGDGVLDLLDLLTFSASWLE